jgi:hypothetical protein
MFLLGSKVSPSIGFRFCKIQKFHGETIIFHFEFGTTVLSLWESSRGIVTERSLVAESPVIGKTVLPSKLPESVPWAGIVSNVVSRDDFCLEESCRSGRI